MKLKIAILHDYFDKFGGGERLVLNLAKELNADIYTGFIERDKTFDTKGINIISLNVKNKGNALYRNKKIEKKFSKLKLTGYDLYIFSGIWCISAASNHKPNFLYLHTTPRFLYDLKKYYLEKMNFIQKFFFKRFLKKWEPFFKANINHFDTIGTNSENVKKRVMTYLGEDVYKKCKVVYTGFETNKFYYNKQKEYYLSPSRLDELKRIDIIIKAFLCMPEKKLIISGTGPDEQRLKKMAENATNIEFVGNVNENELLGLYSKCNAAITAAVDEDLGMVPLESNAAGKPCIAVREGGFLETIKEGKNGLFFNPDEKSLLTAIEKFEKMKWNYRYIKETSKQYDIKVFSNKIRKIVLEAIKKRKL